MWLAADPMIKRATLIYNPRSGRGARERRVNEAAAALRELGVAAEVEPTSAAGSATQQAAQAVERGCDAVIACGGDGTVLEVLQSVVNTNVALGVLPMGTKNALAFELGIPRDPRRAARMLASSETVGVAVGRAKYARGDGRRGECYFMSAAGIGSHAEMMYRMAANLARRRSMWSYYREGFGVFLRHDYRDFEAQIVTLDGKSRRERVSDLMAVRLSEFGGILSRLAPGAALSNPAFRLVLFKTRRRWPYIIYAAGVASRRGWLPKQVEMVDASEVSCAPSEGSQRICVQADGESLGTAPATLKIGRDVCRLLVPSKTGPGDR